MEQVPNERIRTYLPITSFRFRRNTYTRFPHKKSQNRKHTHTKKEEPRKKLLPNKEP